MAQQTKSLEELIRELPEDLRQEATDFVEFLIQKRTAKPAGQLKLNWRGALKDLHDQYTSVELQHLITNEWRDEDIT